MINHDNQAMNDGFDLFCADMNDGFAKVYSRFEIVDSQFDLFRADMDAGFEALHATLVRKLIQMGVLNTFGMIAILAIDRWWL